MSDKAFYNLIKARVGAVLSPLAKTNQLLSTSHIVTLKNIETNGTKKYSSIHTAALKLKVNHATLLNYINKDNLYKGKYMIKRVNKKKMIVQLVKPLISCIKYGNSSIFPGYFHILSYFILLLLIFSAVSKHALEDMNMQASAEKDEASAEARGAVFG